MESLFLSSSSVAPSIALQMRAIRRIGGNLQIRQGDPWLFRSLWDDLFYNYDTRNKVVIKAVGNAGDSRTLKVSFSENVVQVIPFDKKPAVNQEGMPQVTFSWKSGGGPEIPIKPKFTREGLEMVGSNAEFFSMAWFSPSNTDSAEDTAKRFSELSKSGRSSAVVDAVRREFSFITDISIEYLSGIPMLFAGVEGTSRRMPVGLISDGVNRLLSLLIGIAYFRNGIVLIDELEDGFYYELLPSIWKTLLQMSSINNVQLFISTHSAECIRALGTTLHENHNHFRLLRAQRLESGCTIDSIEADILESALEQRIEVR